MKKISSDINKQLGNGYMVDNDKAHCNNFYIECLSHPSHSFHKSSKSSQIFENI